MAHEAIRTTILAPSTATRRGRHQPAAPSGAARTTAPTIRESSARKISGKPLIYWAAGQENVKTRDGINTDNIMPSEFCASGNPADLWAPWGEKVMAHIDPSFRAKLSEGQTFVVAGENFGEGSSREMAPAGLLRAAKDMGHEGQMVIVAKSFGKIFRQNSLNLGLHLVESREAVEAIERSGGQVASLEFDSVSRALTVNFSDGSNQTFNPKPFSPIEEEIRQGGGLIAQARATVGRRGRRRDASEAAIAERFPDANVARELSLAEQIIYAHRADGKQPVRPGTIPIFADVLAASDGTAPFAISVFLEITGGKIRPWKTVIINDHFFPCQNDEERNQYKIGVAFAKRFGLTSPFFTEIGDGIFHFHLPYSGLVMPGMVVITADSHGTTHGGYGALGSGSGSTELGAAWATKTIPFGYSGARKVVFNGILPSWVTGKDVILAMLQHWGKTGVPGQALDLLDPGMQLTMPDRHTIANMIVEGQGVSGTFQEDEVTQAFFRRIMGNHHTQPFPQLFPGDDARYVASDAIDLSSIPLMVATPGHPSNGRPAADYTQRVQLITLGSCTNGSYEDMRMAAFVLQASGQARIADGTRLVVYPGNKGVLARMQQPDPLLGGISVNDIFKSMGGKVLFSNCGHCFKPTEDSVGQDGVEVSTANRNWPGRGVEPGTNGQRILAGPAVAAASAVTGKVSTPEEVGAKWNERLR